MKTSFWVFILGLLWISIIHGQDYYWPLTIEPRLSSYFGDYRTGHWHAGIDITTRGGTGYKVYAAADGYVFRVRTRFWGYGKALYLRLNDGHYAVYGHLEDFSPGVNEMVRQRQLKDGEYYQDLYLRPDEFPIKKGELVALSGQSGSGAPHLHFEIRDRDNYPINPLNGIFNRPDKNPPVVDYLVLKRYRNYGFANYHDLEFLPLAGKSPNYIVPDTIAIYNTITLAAAAYDPESGFDYGIYSGGMLLDSVAIFGFETDKLNYESGPQIDYVRDNELRMLVEKRFGAAVDNDKNVFYRLYIQPDDVQLFYNNFHYPAGIIHADSLTPGVHSLVINFTDVHKNSCSIRLFLKTAVLDRPVIDSMSLGDRLTLALDKLLPDQEPQIQHRASSCEPYKQMAADMAKLPNAIAFQSAANKGDFRIRIRNKSGAASPWVEFTPFVKRASLIPYADYLDIITQKANSGESNDLPLADFTSTPLLNNYIRAQIPIPIKNGYFMLNLKGLESEPGYYIFDAGGKAYSPDSSVHLQLSDQNLYGRSILRITNPRLENPGKYTFGISPEGLLLKNPALIEIAADRFKLDTAYMSLYYYLPGQKRWIYIGDKSLSNLTGKTGGGGKFGIIEDKNPPSIARVKPQNGSITKDKTPFLLCRISDDLSGFDDETQLEMTIDNIWVPAAYDVDTGEFAYQIQNQLKPGKHILTVTATDNQGNKTKAVSKFTIQ